jgi:type IX secretion system PorP/SprF family membrane protein
MKYILTLLICVCASLFLQGQQDPHNTFFMYNQSVYNPGSVGSKGYASINAIYRHQWLGFEGAPISQNLAFDAPLVGDRVGIGINLRHYTIGINTAWRAAMAYSYKMQLTPDAALRFGIQGSVHYTGMNFNGADVIVDKDNDNSFINGFIQKYTGNVGAGLYFNYRNTLWAGISTPAFYPVTLGANNDVAVTAVESPHYYASFGGLLEASEKIQIKPSFLVKYTPNAPVDVDINLSLSLNRALMIGAAYRLGGDNSGDSVDFLAGYQLLHNLMLGVAYDVTLSGLRDHNNGSLEVLLRYDVKSEKADLENPRFF